MSKTVLLAAAAAFALTAGGASAATPVVGVHAKATSPVFHIAPGAKMLYNQNSPNGVGLVSQNFTSGTFSPTYNAAGADDFVVPKKHEWIVTEVDVSGLYFNGYGPATSENVIFYADANGMPGNALKGGTFTDIKGTDTSGSFNIPLGKGMKLKKAGTYWVSVVANKSYANGNGEWGWETTTAVHGNGAMWENPDNGFGTGCTTWAAIGGCLGYSGDFSFDLQGKSKKT